jgi:hypothetical protein
MKPNTAVGKKAIITRFKTSKFKTNDFQYKTTTERIAPSCIEISKLFIKSDWLIFKASAVKIRCPVEDIGKNSVIPSTIPKITAFIYSTMK